MNILGTTLRIDEVPQAASLAALELLFSHCTAGDRQRQMEELQNEAYPIRFHEDSTIKVSLATNLPTTLVGAWRNEQLVGAGCCSIHPGKTATVWLPRLIVEEPLSTAQSLLEFMEQHLLNHGVRLFRVILDSEQNDIGLLRSGKIRYVTDLCYMVCFLKEQKQIFPQKQKHEDLSLEFEPYQKNNRERLRWVMESTYEGTEDCKGLGIGQDTQNLLFQLEQNGTTHPNHWFILRHQERDIGCALFLDYPTLDMMELIYLGLVPQSRGKGLGRRIVEHGKRLANQAGRSRMVTVVDAANRRAMQTYISTGFQTFIGRQLYIKYLVSAG